MLLKLRERMAGEKGFTLIELLVVMLIIGILAAIAIPTFFNQKEKAKDADTKAMAHAAQTAIETYAVDSNGTYAGADGDDLHAIESTVPNTAGGTVVTDHTGAAGSVPDADSYRVMVTANGRSFGVARNGGTFTYPCTPVGGGCPTGGDWGG
jgi:prepilin-type N-terminal cleavage/methylation domain-containing protein